MNAQTIDSITEQPRKPRWRVAVALLLVALAWSCAEVWSSTGVQDRVKEVIVEQLGADPEEVTMEASLRDDLGADDNDVTEVVMALEESFGIEISDEEASSMTTVRALVEYVQNNAGDHQD